MRAAASWRETYGHCLIEETRLRRLIPFQLENFLERVNLFPRCIIRDGQQKPCALVGELGDASASWNATRPRQSRQGT